MENYYQENPLAPGEHDFALIDRMKHPDIAKNWPVQELVSPMLKPQAHLYPWLLPLKEMNSGDWQTLIVDLGQASSQDKSPISSLLISSNLPMAEVRSQLIRALHFTDENHQGHILRYYDPRVLFHLCWMLAPYQLAQILPVREIPHWTFWLDDKWHTLKFPTEFSRQPGEAGRFPLEQLQRCGLINQVLAQLPSAGNMLQRQQVSQRIDALLAQAAELRLTSEHDQCAFALQGLKLRDAFWTAPKMATFLRQAQLFPDTFHDETRLWDAEHWDSMTQR